MPCLTLLWHGFRRAAQGAILSYGVVVGSGHVVPAFKRLTLCCQGEAQSEDSDDESEFAGAGAPPVSRRVGGVPGRGQCCHTPVSTSDAIGRPTHEKRRQGVAKVPRCVRTGAAAGFNSDDGDEGNTLASLAPTPNAIQAAHRAAKGEPAEAGAGDTPPPPSFTCGSGHA